MNLGAAKTELADRGYARFSAARRAAWLNTAKNRFEDYQFDWPWLKGTATPGAAPLTIADLRRVRSVVDSSNGVQLTAREAEDILEFDDDLLTTSGAPFYWYLSSETVVSVYPAQTATLSVRYVKFSPELSGDSDTPLIPVRYHPEWITLAEVEALRWGVKDAGMAASLEASAMARIGEIAAVYAMQGVPVHDEMLMTGASTDG